MKNFTSFLNSQISLGFESKLVSHISNNIILKNRKADSQFLGDLTISYLFNIANVDYIEEVNKTPFAKESMQTPLSTLQLNVYSCFRDKKSSMKTVALNSLIAFEKEFLNNLQEYQEIYSS